MKIFYIYILTNKRNGMLYAGVTSNLKERVFQHKNGLVEGFTKKYKVRNFIYYEKTIDVINDIKKEKKNQK